MRALFWGDLLTVLGIVGPTLVTFVLIGILGRLKEK